MGTDEEDIPYPTLDELKSLLYEGLNLVIQEAKSRNVLQPPYGRPTLTTIADLEAKMNEESSDEEDEAEDPTAPPPPAEEAEDDVSAGDEDVPFTYDYGFNPVLHLATFLKENNPRYKALMERSRQAAALAAAEAVVVEAARLKEERSLLLALDKSLAGIALGPSAGCLTDRSCLVWFVASYPGGVQVVLSPSPDFSSSCQEQSVGVGDSPGLPLHGSVTFSNLLP